MSIEIKYDDVMTPQQAAEYLHIHLKTVYKLAEQGKLPGKRVGRNWRFSRAALEQVVGVPKD